MIGNDNTDNKNVKKTDNKNKLESIMDISTEIKPTHKYKGDEDILFNSNLNSKNIQKDLLLFKNEILKDLKRHQIKIIEKTEDNERYTTEKIEEFSIKIQKFGEQIMNLSNMIITDKTIREQVEQLIQYRTKNQELVMTQGIKIDHLDKDIFNNVFRIDNILKESVIYPGVIGSISKFKTFHDFIDYVLKECATNITFREKTAVDIINLRNNDERIISNLTTKLEKARKALTLYIDTCIKKVDNKINSLNDSFIDKITNYRIESMTYSENMKKASESLLKQVNSVIQAKNDIFNKFDEKMNMINKENARMIKYFTSYKNEFNEMRRIFKEMMEAVNTKDFVGVNRKLKRIARRSTMINNDFRALENNLKNINNIVHPVSMTDMFMSEGKINKPKLSVKTNNMPFKELDRSNPYQLFLKEYRRIDTETRRISRFFEKDNILTEKKKKNEDLKTIIKEKEKRKEKQKEKEKKKHIKKPKLLNEIYLKYNNRNNIEVFRRKVTKFNSVCVPNKKFGLNLLQNVLFENVSLEKQNSKKNMKTPNNKQTKTETQLNSIQETIYDTSLSKSQNSIFSNSSKSSEKSIENRKNIIKTKYTTNIVIKEKKEFNSSNSLNDKESLEQDKIILDKKDFKEDKDSNSLRTSSTQKIYFDNKRESFKSEKKTSRFETRNIKEKQNKNKLKEKSKEEQPNSLNKIYITIEGNSPLEIDPNSNKNNQNQKKLVNNVKVFMNNNMGKTLTGFPKIMTNNGERVIYSSHPIYKKQNFSSYTNPNLLALNYSIHNLYDNNNKLNKTKKAKMGSSPDNIFQNKQLLSKMKNSNDNNTEREKKVSFNLFKSSNLIKNFNTTQKGTKEEGKF